MSVLFECDRCSHREWRDERDEVTLCPACGYMRWGTIVDEPEGELTDTDDEGEESS